MSKTTSLISVDQNGEIVYHGLNSHMSKKYRADNPFDNAFVPYVIMVLCLITDCSIFLSLFKLLSYDNPFMIIIQCFGFAFAFDVIPIFLGIQLRRVKQGLSKDKFIMWLALTVCVLACVMNAVLQIGTIELRSPDVSTGVSYFGTAIDTNTTQEVDSSAVFLTLVSIAIPVFTSVGSFYVSYVTYNPLQIRKRREEEMLVEKKDEIRRLDAILAEYDADTDFAEHLVQDDEGKFQEMKKMQRALVLSYCDYIRQRLKEHLANPTAINALSEETCVAILERLDRELAALDKAETPKVYIGSGSKDKMMASNEAAA